jgi:hypothetical protein
LSNNWLSKEINDKFMLELFLGGNNKDFTKATYLALANVMKLLRIGIKAGNGYRTEEL